MFAERGYRVRHRPDSEAIVQAARDTGDDLDPDKRPDYTLEGRVFDHYAPKAGTSPRNVASEIQKRKLGPRQTQRVVLDLRDWGADHQTMAQQFKTWPMPRLRELKLITQDEQFIQVRLPERKQL